MRAVIVRDLHGKLLGLVAVPKVIAALGRQDGALAIEDLSGSRGLSAADNTGTEDLLALMERHRVRHVPVVANAVVVGLVSERDVRKTKAGVALRAADAADPYGRRPGIAVRPMHAALA